MVAFANLVWQLLLLMLSLSPTEAKYQWPATLSEWNLFQSPLSNLEPVPGVVLYTVNAPLYSDYAYKVRFIKIPDGKSATFSADHVFDMPDGTVLIKTFYYPHDERQPDKARTILETRLIIRKQGTWHALAYRWNKEQTEAVRAIAGGAIDVEWIDKSGKQKQLHYLIPDANQCKNCHNTNDELLPLGITARQLNGSGDHNQLLHWKRSSLLDALPANIATIETLVDYDNGDFPLETRARSYLDANCGHCHSSQGSARTSGLNLNFDETNPRALGVMKPPVAAGRGSGGKKYSIVPGKPNQSILLYRMESNDPGVRMPEINRQVSHDQGIQLIREWIKRMNDE